MATNGIDPTLMDTIYKEVVKALQVKQCSNASSTTFTFIFEIGEFVGNVYNNHETCSSSCENVQGNTSLWIIHIRTTDRMATEVSLFKHVYHFEKPIHVSLLNGTIKQVTIATIVKLVGHFTLRDVLHVPEFKHNLLSTGILLDDANLLDIFS